MDKSQIRTNKDDCMDAKVWALHERYEQDTRSRAPLDSTAIYPITRSLTKHNETGKIETLSRLYLCLALKPLEVDEDDLQLLKTHHLSSLRFAWWRFTHGSPIHQDGRSNTKANLHMAFIFKWLARSKHMTSSCWSSWTWTTPFDTVLHELHEIFLLMQAHDKTPNPT